MKIIVALCSSFRDSISDRQCEALLQQLRGAEHRTDVVKLPPIGTGFEALSAAFSHRLMKLQSFCDALICLDRVACLLPHDRKFALLSDPGFDEEAKQNSLEETYLSNLIEGGVREAKRLAPLIYDTAKDPGVSNLVVDISPVLRAIG